ncbi:MAG: tetratricopeptide repeat protein [Gemmataceae bacterium]
MLKSEDKSELDDDLLILRVAEIEVTDGPDAALTALGALTDPNRIRSALGILLRAKRVAKAGELIREFSPDQKWIDLAIAVYAMEGETNKARELLSSLDHNVDSLFSRRARVAFAEGVRSFWQSLHESESLLGIRDWSSENCTLATEVIDVLDPLLSAVRGRGRIQSDLELSAVEQAIYCAHVASDDQTRQRAITWLIHVKPVPLVVAEMCLRSFAECPPDLPQRLWTEHPGNFDAGLLAALLRRDVLKNPNACFGDLTQLAPMAVTDRQKELVSIAILETLGKLQASQIDEAFDVVSSLVPNNKLILGVLKVSRCLADRKFPEARQLLDEIKDENDGLWWQAEAQYLEQMHEEDGAQKAWEKASDLVPHSEVVKRSIKASIDRRRFESVIRGAEKVLSQDPNDRRTLEAAAWASVQLGDQVKAVHFLERLLVLEPNEFRFRVSLAQALARSTNLTKAIEVLSLARDDQQSPVQAIGLLAVLLEADHRADEAFQVMELHGHRFWNDPHFLLQYVHTGYASGHDRDANKAFMRLLELRREGKAPPELLQTGTLEQLLELGREYRDRREMLQESVVGGKLPWLFAEEILGNAALWAWTLHTQPLQWFSEERLNRAAFSVYATNAFFVAQAPKGKQFRASGSSPAGCPVVIDLTALLTLHKLGRLKTAADYFGKLIVPASYGELRLKDATHFGDHQPSREEHLKTIRTALERGQLRVVENIPTGCHSLDEYTDDLSLHSYRLVDVGTALGASQRATALEIEELRLIAQHPSGCDGSHPQFTVGAQLVIDLETLRSIAGLPIFERALDAFELFLTSSDLQQMNAELRAYEVAHKARDSHDAMWNTVRSLIDDGALEWATVPKVSTLSIEGEDARDWPIHLDSYKVAQSLRLPLLADDRVLHSLALYAPPSVIPSAFGTDSLLLDWWTAYPHDRATIAANLYQLIEWRYRFYVIPGEILFEWAKEHSDKPPGSILLSVSDYIHDSLRDPGLHCGLEVTEPPMPMAVKFVTSWLHSIAVFVGLIWKDSRFTERAAVSLTQWVGQELVPSCPLGLWFHPLGHNLSYAETRGMLSSTMVQLVSCEDPMRANLALRALAAALGFDEDDFLTIAAEAIHATQ